MKLTLRVKFCAKLMDICNQSPVPVNLPSELDEEYVVFHAPSRSK